MHAELFVKPEIRTSAQNRLFQKLLGEVSEQYPYRGHYFNIDDWRRLTLNAFRHETEHDPVLREEWKRFGELKMVPALNNPGFVAIGESSRMLTEKLANAYIEWLYAFGGEIGVKFSAHPSRGDDSEPKHRHKDL